MPGILGWMTHFTMGDTCLCRWLQMRCFAYARIVDILFHYISMCPWSSCCLPPTMLCSAHNAIPKTSILSRIGYISEDWKIAGTGRGGPRQAPSRNKSSRGGLQQRSQQRCACARYPRPRQWGGDNIPGIFRQPGLIAAAAAAAASACTRTMQPRRARSLWPQQQQTAAAACSAHTVRATPASRSRRQHRAALAAAAAAAAAGPAAPQWGGSGGCCHAEPRAEQRGPFCFRIGQRPACGRR